MSDVSKTTGAPEVVIGPLTMYVSKTAQLEYPRIDAAPPSAYKLIGKRGAVHYTDDGTTVRMQRTLNKVYGGSTALPLKAYITDADIMVALAVRDARLQTLADAMGFDLQNNRMPLDEWGDLDLNEFSILLRGLSQSPITRGKRMQFWYQRAVFGASEVALQYYKTGATEIPLEYTLLEGVPVLGRLEGDANPVIASIRSATTKTFALGTHATAALTIANDATLEDVATVVQAGIRAVTDTPYDEVYCIYDSTDKRFRLGGYRSGDLPLPTGGLASVMGFTSAENNVITGAKFGVAEQQP